MLTGTGMPDGVDDCFGHRWIFSIIVVQCQLLSEVERKDLPLSAVKRSFWCLRIEGIALNKKTCFTSLPLEVTRVGIDKGEIPTDQIMVESVRLELFKAARLMTKPNDRSPQNLVLLSDFDPSAMLVCP